jgi:predicted GIY-YIG superfamily endonuclease
MRKPFVSLIFILLSAAVGFSQATAVDSLFFQEGKQNIQKIYDRALAGSHLLYNGLDYLKYEPLLDEHPFFLSDEWAMGNVRYDGEFFADVPMLFDIANSKLIVSNYANGNKLQLNEELIDEFSIDAHSFVHRKHTSDTMTLTPGFYESLYGGKTQVLARRVKKFHEKIQGYERTRSFDESTLYFVRIHGRFVGVARKHQVLRALGSNKKELRNFIRQNQLFIKNRETSIVQVAKYFDTLNP